MTRAAYAQVPIRNFEPHEVALAIAGTAGVLSAFFTLLIVAGQNTAHVQAKEPPPEKEVPMSVRPIMDDLPLLKLGGKKVKAKLPDMWRKNPPVQRFEESSAPSTKASKSAEKLPTSPLAKLDASAPPPDAEVAKKVDQVLLDAGPPDAAPAVEGEGSPDGVKEGTETDPLKARAVSQYRARIIAWFNARFRQPVGEVPCAELKKLGASVSVNVSGDRRVGGFSVTGASGNAIFDERARSTMERTIGEELPPPPPLYPDILGTTIALRFTGREASCDDKPVSPPSPAPSAAPPSAPPPPAPGAGDSEPSPSPAP